MSTSSPSSVPVERIKAVNHHLRVALDQVSDAVLILQNGLTPEDGPVIAWGNEAAVACTGVAAPDLFGSPLQPLLTAESWQILLQALQDSFTGEPASCTLTFLAMTGGPRQARIKATCGPAGEVLGVILTMEPLRAAAPEAKTSPSPAPLSSAMASPPSPQGWQEDVIETIRETARQVAHEFNNALTSIVLPVQLAIRAIPQNGDLYDSLEVAHVSAQRASNLAKDFLDCFRPRSSVRSRCAPGDLLGRAIRLATCAQNVTASVDLQAHLPNIEVDESQLERVVFNLIRNSVQAMPNGGRLRVTALRRDLTVGDTIALPAGPYILISVRDWGPGIPDEHLQHLFHGRFTTKPEGNGCGLPICYQIVRDHGGEMLVRSRVNVGTEFLIYLPAVLTPEESTPATGPVKPADSSSPLTDLQSPPAPGSTGLVPLPALAPLTAPVPMASASVKSVPVEQADPAAGTSPVSASGSDSFSWLSAEALAPVPVSPLEPDSSFPALPLAGSPPEAVLPELSSTAEDAPPSLLVVDDEQGVRTALSQIARVMGFDVATVATSDEALQSYKDRLHAARPFSTVLLDLNLRSGLNGMEVFQAIRRMDPEALIVATSGQHAEGDVERFRSLGFAGFLPKPYSLEHFDSVMRAALAS